MTKETTSVLDQIVERGKLRIAVQWLGAPDTGSPPEMYLDPETGAPSGIAPEIGRMIAEDLDVELECVDIPWPQQIPALLEGMVDILPKHTLIPSRAVQIEFTDGRWIEIRVSCLVRKDGDVKAPEDLHRDGITIATWHGSSIAEMIRRRFPHAKLLEAQKAHEEVATGDADAALNDSVTHRFLEINSELDLLRRDDGQVQIFSREYNKIAVKPGDQRFLNWLNSWYDYRHAQGDVTYWAQEWWEAYMADQG